MKHSLSYSVKRISACAGLFSLFLCLGASHSVIAQTWQSDSLAVRAILTANGISLPNILSCTDQAGGRIIAVHLNAAQLTVLPPDIGDLTALELLDIANNQLPSLPEEIGNCLSLQKLYLQGNLLDSLPARIANIPLSRTMQIEGYGCQIYYDGACIQYGPVLMDTTIATIVNLAGNRLCAFTGPAATWATTADPDWSATQNCGSATGHNRNSATFVLAQLHTPATAFNARGQALAGMDRSLFRRYEIPHQTGNVRPQVRAQAVLFVR